MSTTPIRLLYIDDDVALVRLVERSFARRGYVVEGIDRSEAALARIAAGGIDAVALDHYMPGQDGLGVLAEISAMVDPPPVIFVTGTDESSVAIAALKSGASDYVVKDVGDRFLAALDTAIRTAIETVGQRRQKAEAEREVRLSRDRFEALAAERQMLMQEVNHRVGNSLQLVAAFLHMQSARATDETRAALTEANRRVLAIAQVHRRLYSSDDVSVVALHHYLSGLVDDIRQSADGEAAASQVALEADVVEIDPDRAVSLGVIVTELVINAMKYAYPSGVGPIRISLKRHGRDECHLAVEDDGIGMADRATARRTGIGTSIISAMASKLGAEVSYGPANPGTRALVRFKAGADVPLVGA